MEAGGEARAGPAPAVAARPQDPATARRRIAALERDNAELLRSNADLMELASVAAHELRSPLQTIVGYADLLAADAGGDLDAENRRRLDGLRTSAARLSALVEGLLVYARVGTTVRRREDVDLEVLVAGACEDLAASMAAAGATVDWADLPTVRGEAAELALVVRNLVANALTHRRPDRPPTVRVSAGQSGGAWRVSVSDDGPGIDERDRERVFRAFQRGPVQGPGAGTGLGLAVCRRIVEGHGGRIWAEGNDRGGATVSFTVPIPVCWSPF